MAKSHLTPRQRAQLVRLNARLQKVLGFEASRDPRTGTFKTGSSISAKSIRAAWQLTGTRGVRRAANPRDAFKTQLLAALRVRPTK